MRDLGRCDWTDCDEIAAMRRTCGRMFTKLCRYHDDVNESLSVTGYSSVNPRGPRPEWHHLDEEASDA